MAWGGGVDDGGGGAGGIPGDEVEFMEMSRSAIKARSSHTGTSSSAVGGRTPGSASKLKLNKVMEDAAAMDLPGQPTGTGGAGTGGAAGGGIGAGAAVAAGGPAVAMPTGGSGKKPLIVYLHQAAHGVAAAVMMAVPAPALPAPAAVGTTSVCSIRTSSATLARN